MALAVDMDQLMIDQVEASTIAEGRQTLINHLQELKPSARIKANSVRKERGRASEIEVNQLAEACRNQDW